jgi:hypothetical protein
LASRAHSDQVDFIIEKFGLYTSVKNMPAALICEHKNQVGTFKRNFIAGHTPVKQLTGYATEDDKRITKIKFRDMKAPKDSPSKNETKVTKLKS